MSKKMKLQAGRGTLGAIIKKNSGMLLYIVMVLVFTLIKPRYLSPDNFKSILIQVSLLGLIGCGMTLVVMSGGADMSVGAVAGASTLAGIWPVVFMGLPVWIGIVIALLVALLFGAINGFCVSRLGVAPFVASLGSMFLAEGLQYLFSEGGMSISYGFPQNYIFLGTGSLGSIPMPVVIFLGVFIALLLLTEYSPIGRYIKATGMNQFTSELSGVRIRMYTFLSYLICALLAAVLGLVLGASQSYISPDHGSSFLMDSLLVVLLGKTLIGGKISVSATAFGALFLRSFETGLSMIGIPVTVLGICKGFLLVGILLLTLLRQVSKRRQPA